MRHSRRPVRHPLAALFFRAVDSIAPSLCPDTVRGYHATVRHFLRYLGADHQQLCRLDELHRDPHILDWLRRLSSQDPPLVKASYLNHVVRLRRILEELAWIAQLPDLVHLLRREDIPRHEERLPRPLTIVQDQLIQQELLRRNDVPSYALLLLRYTGMRIGECTDLSCDCLHSSGPDQWAIRVPLGKLKKERMVPVDDFVCQLVRRLRFLRSIDPMPEDGFLLPRPRGRDMVMRELQRALHEVAATAGITTRIVPHQFRHTFATEMLRAGVSFPGIMKLLGHSSPTMTMRYLGIVLTDLRREFEQARLQPRHLAPHPKTPTPINASNPDLPNMIEALQAGQHVLEMFRRMLPEGSARRTLNRLGNRLMKIISEARKLSPPQK